MRDETDLTARFEQKYETYGGMVYRLAMVYLANRADAEDAVQEVFLRYLYRAPRFKDGEHERKWLLRVTANLCRDMLRRAARTQTVELDEAYPAGEPELRPVADAVLRLPEKYKGPIHLYYYEGYTVEEVAQILALSASAVKMRLKRGREMLKLEMEDER